MKMSKDLFEIGQPVYCTLYGGKNGYIYNISGEQDPESCESLGGVIVTGGNAYIDIVWGNGTTSKMLPESLLRSSVQWQITEDKEAFACEEEIQQMLKFAETTTQKTKEAQEQKAKTHQEQKNALPAKYPYLLTEANAPDKVSGQVLAAKNIRVELKKAFPGHKFSVKSESYAGGCSVNIGWTDGPTTDEVSNITGKYQQGHFNSMEDIYEYSDNVFPGVFGSAKHVMENRRISQEATKTIAESLGYKDITIDQHGAIEDVSGEISQHIYRESRKKSFYCPEEAKTGEDVPNTDKAEESQETAASDPTEAKEPATIGEYKGHPTINLPMGSRGFSFGISKAKTIIDYIDEIRDFVNNNQ